MTLAKEGGPVSVIETNLTLNHQIRGARGHGQASRCPIVEGPARPGLAVAIDGEMGMETNESACTVADVNPLMLAQSISPRGVAR